MRLTTLILCLLVAGCTQQDPPGRKIYRSASGAVYDFPVEQVDTIRFEYTMYILRGDRPVPVHPYVVRCFIDSVPAYENWVEVLSDELYPDSLSACRALRDRLESQKIEIEKKMNQLKCEGK